MKSSMLFAFMVCVTINAHSQTIKAGDLEKLCTAKDESDRLSCSLIVKVYMDGFIEGVAKGVLDTYKYDAQVLALVKDTQMKDMAPRIGKVVESATCIHRVSVEGMTDAFLQHVRANPSLREEHYRKALTRAILAKYCGK
jgi:hypothetical protein